MAVLPDWRNRGVGSALLDQLIELARNDGRKPLFLNAQKQAIPFYLRHGFHCVGEVFMEAGIPHQQMEQDEGDTISGRSHHEQPNGDNL